ncbi:MAG TPA: SDR family NAD(P)-dependent oxidoreductase, partial [Calditrichaeota bacterium]|nr:SDR family NAD(P)-dependent oxidoreductase [Calditrichota bacterium]
MNKILVTGAAGFIGFHVSKYLLSDGKQVVGLDIVNDYYDVNLKYARLKQLEEDGKFTFYKIDLSDKTAVEDLFKKEKPEYVINLAAQA